MQPFVIEENRIYYEKDGVLLAEVTFPACGTGCVNINHTFVSDSLRGQGIAGQLLQLCAEQLQNSGRRAKATCSYAKAWFEKHPEAQQLLLP